MECKCASDSDNLIIGSTELIDTLWNVNIFRSNEF